MWKTCADTLWERSKSDVHPPNQHRCGPTSTAVTLFVLAAKSDTAPEEDAAIEEHTALVEGGEQSAPMTVPTRPMLLQFFVVLFLYPETKGRSLEQIQTQLCPVFTLLVPVSSYA